MRSRAPYGGKMRYSMKQLKTATDHFESSFETDGSFETCNVRLRIAIKHENEFSKVLLLTYAM